MTDKTNTAVLNAKALPVSTKFSIEICNLIRNKPLSRARRLLQDAVDMKRPLQLRRHNADLGHKPGLGPARYPIKASEMFLKLLSSVESNAEDKGLNVNNLIIIHAKADKADARWRFGRKGRTKMKNTHVELKVEERNLREIKK